MAILGISPWGLPGMGRSGRVVEYTNAGLSTGRGGPPRNSMDAGALSPPRMRSSNARWPCFKTTLNVKGAAFAAARVTASEGNSVSLLQ